MIIWMCYHGCIVQGYVGYEDTWDTGMRGMLGYGDTRIRGIQGYGDTRIRGIQG